MSLSYDLISEFVKITNDKKDDKKEGTVYATVVSETEGKYVRIDGSDLLTPMDTTTDIEDGERVTLMIKDHKAIVTGNVTTPSASTSKVDKVTESVNSVSDQVGSFELVVADFAQIKTLVNGNLTSDNILSFKLTSEKVTVDDAFIKDAMIDTISAGKIYLNVQDQSLEVAFNSLKTRVDTIQNGNCTTSADSICRTWRYPNGMQISVVKVYGTWDIATAWESVYSSPRISGQSFNIAFSEAPRVTINAYNASSAVMVCQCSGPTTTATGACYLWKPEKQTGTKTWIEYIAIGRWK